MLRTNVALIGRFGEPAEGLFIIFLHYDAVIVEKAQIALRLSVALLRRLTVQLHSLGLVFLDAGSVLIA
ncbi:hypothetical protein D3C86_2022350 [compost metagenome]